MTKKKMQKVKNLWCRLNISYVNAWDYRSSYIVQAQVFLGNEAIKHKHNKKLIRKSRKGLVSVFLKWKNQIEGDGIKCATA